MMRVLLRKAVNWPLLVLSLGMAVTGLATHQLDRYNDEVLKAAREEALSRTLARIDQLLQRYRYGLSGARGAIALVGMDGLTRSAFARYSNSRNYEWEFPGARGFGFVRRVPFAQEHAYVAEQQRKNAPGFGIKQIVPHTGERYVIELIEPIASNRAAVGLDIASEARRREAAQLAMRTGNVTLTGPITLVQASGKRFQSFLMLLPAYRTPGAPRPDNVVGWTYAPIVMSDVLARLQGDLPAGSLVLADVTDSAHPVNFYTTGKLDAQRDVARQVYRIMGREWQATFSPAPAFVAQLNLLAPIYVASFGVVFSFLCSALALANANHRTRQQRLQATKSELAAIVESSVDAIIGSTTDGVVTSWNRGAELLFGYAAATAIGRPISDLIVPSDLGSEHLDIVARVARDESISNLQTRRRDAEGRAIDVSIAVAPLHDHIGAVVGISTTVRDISTLVAAQTAISSMNAFLEQQVAQRTSELERARHDLRTVLDAVPSGIAYWDSNLVNHVANRSYGDWFGIDPGSIPGMSMPQLLGDELFRQNLPYIQAALRGEVQKFERAVTDSNGTVHYSLVNYIPDIRGHQVVGIYVIAHDVSDIVAGRQALASALRENDVLIRTINEQLLYSVTDPEGRILEVNDNFCAAVGYTREQLIGASQRLLESGRDDAASWEDIAQAIAAGRTWRGEVCNRTANGERRWFDTVVAPYFDAEGRIERYVTMRTDVTERLAADTALRRVSALLTNVLRAASEMSLIATDVEGTITVFNSGSERMLGYKQEEVVGLASPALFHVAEEVQARAHELSVLAGRPIDGFETFVYVAEREGAETREWCYVRKDGSRFPVLLTVTSMRDDEGALVGFLGVGVDISQRKRDEEAQRLSTWQAEQASVAKSQFVANMSHEIRTPMNAVLGMLELTRRTELTAEQRDYIDKASRAGGALLALLNDILDFSKIEAGKLELDVQPFDPDLLLRDLAAVLIGNSIDKQVELMFDVAPDLPALMSGDRQRLLQVVVNLAGNALKFTEKGNVVVGITNLDRNETCATLRITVTDTGIGIPPDQLTIIFDSFTQAEASTARRFGGTGLGLAISARLVRLMGSTLQVRSEPQRGSHFWFDVCFPVVESGTERAQALMTDSGPMRVLVIDDNAISADILHRLISGLGGSAASAADVRGALALLGEAAANGLPFHVVLMDEGVSFKELITASRSGGPAGSFRLILLATPGMVQQKASLVRSHAASAVLLKPMTPVELCAALGAAGGPPPGEDGGGGTSQAKGRLIGRRVLVVEDNPLNRQVAFELLVSEGAIVDLAEGGRRGVEMAVDPAHHYDIVLMDVQMPDVDGLEATRRIRLGSRGPHLPIVAMTANASTADRKLCLDAGMDVHIGKPFDIDEVVAVVQRLCGEQAPNVELTAGEQVDASADESDLDGALRRFGGNAELYAAMLEHAESETARLLTAIREHQAHCDIKAMSAALHTLKGMALTIGASKLAEHIPDWSLSDPPSTQVQNAGFVGALAVAAEDSLRALRAAFARHRLSHSTAQAAKPAPTAEQRAAMLTELLDLLESGNLRALDLAEALAPAAPHDPALQAIINATIQLQFAAAADSVRHYGI